MLKLKEIIMNTTLTELGLSFAMNNGASEGYPPTEVLKRFSTYANHYQRTMLKKFKIPRTVLPMESGAVYVYLDKYAGTREELEQTAPEHKFSSLEEFVWFCDPKNRNREYVNFGKLGLKVERNTFKYPSGYLARYEEKLKKNVDLLKKRRKYVADSEEGSQDEQS